MGQYYTPIIIRDNTIETLNSHNYGNGLKLMEHSYVGNKFVNAVLGEIKDRPARIAWMGDYANDEYGDAYETKIPRDELMFYYSLAWRDSQTELCTQIKPEPMEYSKENKGFYLVNHSRKAYVDMDKYNEDNVFDEWWIVNPLPLLTACGNGRGGGDYHKTYPDYGKCGLWAFDEIEFTQDKPEGYTEEEYRFKEEVA